MDPLRADDIARARATPPEVKLAQGLDMMATGIRLKRAALRHRFPDESEDRIDERMRRWLARDDQGAT